MSEEHVFGDAELFKLTRDTSWITPAGDWVDTRPHLLILNQLAKWVNWMNPSQPHPACAPICVEIGVREGPTTLALLHAMRETNGKLISIECDPDCAAIARDVVEKAGLSQWWELHVMRSEQYAEQLPPEIDFLWIDGDHGEAQVRLDVHLYASHVRVGGLIAMHDYWSDAWCLGPPQGEVAGQGSDVSVIVEEMRATGKYDLMTIAISYGLTLARKVRL